MTEKSTKKKIGLTAQKKVRNGFLGAKGGI
jgi:hypothetical protein